MEMAFDPDVELVAARKEIGELHGRLRRQAETIQGKRQAWWDEKEAREAAEPEIARLHEAARVPGAWVCNTCGFRLQKMKIRAADMAVGVDNAVVEDICPNDGTSMRALTWKEDAEASDRVGREYMARADAADALLRQVVIAWASDEDGEMEDAIETLRKWLGEER